jgi:reactive chlorine resistance protein C
MLACEHPLAFKWSHDGQENGRSPVLKIMKKIVASIITDPMLSRRLQAAGFFILRYGLVALPIVFGLQKWTRAEAEGIQPWVGHSPWMSWLYGVTSVQGASIVIGIVELTIAAMIALRRWLPWVSAVGGAMAIAMFLTTLSFLITTPKIDEGSQGFLIKDIFLLGAAVWSTGESLAERARRVSP